ncbi:MAG TPA: hypothetical protein VN541_21360 [Tepidisphaeraceae bacterium]|nr:hypothetical protein [Tepidisphaeraceae bacterium]
MAKEEIDVLAMIDAANPIESRASLSRWMRQNHDALLARFDAARPDWTALAKVFADAGLRDRSGKPASPATVRAAWGRVRKAVAASRAKNQPNPARPTRAPDAPAEPTTPQGTSDARPPSAGGTGTGFRAPDQRIKEGELEALLGPLHPTKRK